jgi:hypothetical protein
VRPRFLLAPLLAAAIGLGAVSCLGGEDPAEESFLPPPPPATADAPPPTGPSALATMVLPQPAYGAEADGLRLDERASGLQDNDDRAAETPDPYDTAEALSGYGRQAGYAADFFDNDLSALLEGGVFEASSSVELFADPGAASASIVRELADLQRVAGKDVDGEVRILRVRTFATDLPEAIGFQVQERLAGKVVWRTYVRLRHGSIVGTAALVRADRRDVRERVTELARALERRIGDVLEGRLTADAVPLPGRANGPADASPAT